MRGFSEPDAESKMQWRIWENFLTHEASWGGMEHDPHDHCDALYNIPYVRAGLEVYQKLVPQNAKHVLEVGCAQGYILNHVGGPNTSRTGIDFNEDRVRKGRNQYPQTRFIVGDIRHMPLSREYDYVLLPGVLEHVRYQEAREIVEKAIAACLPGGMVIFDLPWWSGQPGDFNDGIHSNPSHAWTCTQYRWDWLFRGIDVERFDLPGVNFYVMGYILVPEKRTLVGCWGKIGDIVHAMPAVQALNEPVHVAYSPDFAAVGGVLDLLDGDITHAPQVLDYTSTDLGVHDDQWRRVLNLSHSAGRTDPKNGWDIFGWWDNRHHAIDFFAALARLKLSGRERYLRFKDGVRDGRSSDVVFLSNCADPAMRGLPADWFPETEAFVRELGGDPMECSIGPIRTGRDAQYLSIGEVVVTMASAKLIVSVDTMASALIAQSLGTPILRLYTGATKTSMTGVTDTQWVWWRAVTGTPPSHEKVKQAIEELWKWTP
jgi:trans-aconitate methyltransferase